MNTLNTLQPSAKVPTNERGGSAFADRQAAVAAVELLLPAFSAALQSDFVGDSGCLHIVVMDPALGPSLASFDDAILYEFSLPDPQYWDADYRAYARAKARLSWETGRDGHLLQANEPHRLRAGDTTLWGRVALDGIVVGVSGAQPWFDEAFAGCIAHCLRAIAKHRAHATPDTLAL
ncbi:TetR family transcriptional regulator [Burkholderia pseudomallei]